MATRGWKVDWEDLSHDRGFTDDRAMLEEYYLTRGMSQEDIALDLDVCNKVVSQRMKHYGIPVRAKRGPKPGEPRGPRVPQGR